MIKALKILLVALCFCSVFSCSTTKYSYRLSNLDKTNIITNDVVVDVVIDLEKKVVQESDQRNTPEAAKEEAYYKAIKNNDIDIIVDPIYEITKSLNNYKAKITGFSGYYKNPRNKIDVIKELKDIDVSDIKKYDYIFGERVFKTESTNLAVLPSGKKQGVKKFLAKTLKNKKPESDFVPKKSFGAKLALSRGDIRGASNSGIALGFIVDNQFKEKFGLRTEFLFSMNEAANNINMPVLLTFGRKFKVLGGTSFTINFNPKDIEETPFSSKEFLIDLYRDSVPTINLGVDFGFSYSLTKELSIESRSTIALTADDFTQSYLGLSYKFN